MKSENSRAVRTVVEMNVERRRGRPMKKWLNAIDCDTRINGVCVEDVGDCVKWRFRTKVTDPD